MAERALPAATTPRTVTVRVRSLVIAVVILLVGACLVWSLRWDYGPFHAVRIPADGTRSVTFVFTANPRACANPEDRMPGTSIQDSVTIHFTTLGILHGTQTVPLGWATVDMAAPTKAACA